MSSDCVIQKGYLTMAYWAVDGENETALVDGGTAVKLSPWDDAKTIKKECCVKAQKLQRLIFGGSLELLPPQEDFLLLATDPLKRRCRI